MPMPLARHASQRATSFNDPQHAFQTVADELLAVW